MSQITLRGNKSSALTYAELDENFTTIGLADGMDTTAGNVAISVNTVTATTGTITTGNIDTVNADDIDVTNSILINSVAESWNSRTRPVLATAEADSIDAAAKFVRPGTGVGSRSAVVTHTEFGVDTNGDSINAQAGLGTGFWGTIGASDLTEPLKLSGIQSELKGYFSTTDYTPVIKLYTYDNGDSLNPVLEASTDEVKFTNTDQVTVDAPLKIAHYTSTEITALTGVQNGTIVFNTTVNQFQGWNGSNWIDLGGSGGGTAYDQFLNTTDDVVFNSIEANSFTTTGTGTTEIESATTLTLTSTDGVIVSGAPLRLPSFTTTERDALTAVDGDIILNTSVPAIQALVNGNWVNL